MVQPDPFISRMDLAVAVRSERHLYDGCVAGGLIVAEDARLTKLAVTFMSGD